MNFDPIYTLDSKSCPGVIVTLARLGPKRRGATELKVADARAKYRDLASDFNKLDAELQADLDDVPGYRDAIAALPHDDAGVLVDGLPAEILALIPPEIWAKADQRSLIQAQIAAVAQSAIHPAFIAAAVQSISGLTAGKKPYTGEMVCEYGPDSLFDEIITAINENEYLAKEQAANLQLPTTSGAQGDGGQTSTNAQTAK